MSHEHSGCANDCDHAALTSGRSAVDTSSREYLTAAGWSSTMLDAGGRVAARPRFVRGHATAAPEALCERPLDHFEIRSRYRPVARTLPGMTVDTSSLRIVELDPDDAHAAEASYAIHAAVRAYEQPDLPPPSRHRHVHLLRLGWPGHLEKHWLAYDGDVAVAELDVSLPQRDNLDNAWIDLHVRAEYRRRGIGRRL